MIMAIDHLGVQCDDPMYCEQKHQAILAVDQLDKYEAIRLLFHIIHVQQLQLVGSKIEFDETNPFKDMVNFDYMDSYVSSNSLDTTTI